jgi:hypothetical protein
MYHVTHLSFNYLMKAAERSLAIAKMSEARGLRLKERPALTSQEPEAVGEWVLIGGSFYDCMASITLSMMAIEAGVNHIGTLTFEDWEQTERESLKEKIKRIEFKCNFSVNLNGDPFSDLEWMKKFRDSIAHGKTKTTVSKNGKNPEDAEPDWVKNSNLEYAERARNSAKLMIEQLHSNALGKDIPWGFLHHGSNSSHTK